jgi:putative nucleotidyltransferase with HDIG domain
MSFPIGGDPVYKIALKRIDQIPPLPQSIHQLVAIVNNPKAETAELVAIVEQDPVLAMQLLHLCNSAYYSLPVVVSSIAHAVRFLGMDTVAGLAMAAYFQGMASSGKGGSPWLKGLKEHLLKTAYLSEILAKAGGKSVAPATLFTAGLLHDIGKLVFAKLDPQMAQQVRDCAREKEVSLFEAEQEVLGTNHAEIGYRLGMKWKLPGMLLEAIRYHHEPFNGEYEHPFYVSLANLLANLPSDEEAIRNRLGSPAIQPVAQELGFTPDHLLEVLKTLSDRSQPKPSLDS